MKKIYLMLLFLLLISLTSCKGTINYTSTEKLLKDFEKECNFYR